MTKHRQKHISGWPAVLLAPIAIPIILLIKIAERFGVKATADLTAANVASYLDDFLNRRGGDWDWDDFTSIKITDPALDEIRMDALYVDLPLDAAGEAMLRELLERARQLDTNEH